MAKKTVRISLRAIVTEINKVQHQLSAREIGATPTQVKQLKARVKKLERLSATTRGICRGFFI